MCTYRLTLGIKLNPRKTLMLLKTMTDQILLSKFLLSLTTGNIIHVTININVEQYNVIGIYFESLKTSISTCLVRKTNTNPIMWRMNL